MELAVDRDHRPALTVLALRGELDLATISVLRAEVAAALSAGAPRICIDLSALEFMDSSGCRELVRAGKSGATAGVPVELVVPAANKRVRRVVGLMQLDALLPVHDEQPRP